MEDLTKKTKRIELKFDDSYIEKCVICGADTPYKFSTPISEREYYVEGAGQTCARCHYDIYLTSKRNAE